MASRIAEAAIAVLRDTKNPGVMWGDTVLLHQIGKRAGLKPRHPLALTKAVLDGLDRHAAGDDPLFRRIWTAVAVWNGRAHATRYVRCFNLTNKGRTLVTQVSKDG